MRKITSKVRAEILARRGRGETQEQIGAAVGLHRKTVGEVLGESGAARKTVPVAEVRALAAQKLRISQIAARLGWAEGTIYACCARNGIAAELDPALRGAPGMPRATYREGRKATPFSSRLRALRIAKGLTAAKVAPIAGESEKTYHAVEEGRLRPQPTLVQRLTKFYRLPAAELADLAERSGGCAAERHAKEPSIEELEQALRAQP